MLRSGMLCSAMVRSAMRSRTRRAWLTPLAALLLACGGEPPRSELAPIATSSAIASARPRGPAWCGAPEKLPENRVGECRSEVDGEVATAIRGEILSSYRAVMNSNVSIAFGCERLSSDVREIVVEEGDGHGWGITITWLRRDRDGSFDVRKFGFDGNYNASDTQSYEVAEKLRVSFEKARVAAGVLDPLLPRVRASLLASITDPHPPSFHSSKSFVAGMTLVDDAGSTLERWSAAYEDGDDQADYVPPRVAFETIGAILARLELEAVDLTAADRAFFARRFRATVARFKSPSFPPWTRQAYTGMATWAGSPEIVRTLFSLADDDLEERTRFLAVNALANIAKVDLRRDEDRRDRPLLEVEQRYRRACE